MAKHTPGPWGIWDALGGKKEICTESALRIHIATVHHRIGSMGVNAEANARLIKTAPKMLEALQEIYARTICSTASEIANAAIKEATSDE